MLKGHGIRKLNKAKFEEKKHKKHLFPSFILAWIFDCYVYRSLDKKYSPPASVIKTTLTVTISQGVDSLEEVRVVAGDLYSKVSLVDRTIVQPITNTRNNYSTQVVLR